MVTRTLLRTPLTALATAALAAGALACDKEKGGGGDPQPPRTLDAQSALATANANLRSGLTGAAQSSLFVEGMSVFTELLPALSVGRCTDSPGGPRTCALDLDQTAAEQADDVAARILNMANVEQAAGTIIVLKLKPELMCTASAGGTPASDCVNAYTREPVVLELSSVAEGDIDVAVLLGQARARVLVISLHADELAVELDLGQARAALSAFLAAYGMDASQLPSVMSGKLRASLKREAESVYVASVMVTADVEIAGSGSPAYHVRLGRSAPLALLRIDGAARSLQFESAMGAVDADFPLELIASSPRNCTTGPNGTVCDPPPPPPEGTVGVRFPASQARWLVAAGDAALHLEQLSIGGAARVTLDGADMLSFDLNPSHNRRLAVDLSPDASGLKVDVTPALEVIAAMNLATYATRVGAEIPAWLQSEELSIVLDGAATPSVRFDELDDVVNDRPSTGGEPQPAAILARVLAGNLRLGARNHAAITVSAGMCLREATPPPQNAHPFDSFVAGACQ